MCLAVPGQVIAINGEEATVAISGVRQQVNMMLVPEVKVGQYVLIHAGFALQIVDREAAEDTVALFKELEQYANND